VLDELGVSALGEGAPVAPKTMQQAAPLVAEERVPVAAAAAAGGGGGGAAPVGGPPAAPGATDGDALQLSDLEIRLQNLKKP
jgi:hypothetical protein